MNLSRRDFIKGFGAFVAGLGLGAAKAEAKEVEPESNDTECEWSWIDYCDHVGECDGCLDRHRCDFFDAIKVEAERLKLETLERCTPPDDLVRYPNGKIDVIGTIRAQIDRALR